jgi:hypothetical protein
LNLSAPPQTDAGFNSVATPHQQQEPSVYGSLPSEPFYFRTAATATR